MDNLYQWRDEKMAALKMDEIKSEMDSIRLIRDASISAPGWFERAAAAIGSGLVSFGQRLNRKYATPARSYQVPTKRAV